MRPLVLILILLAAFSCQDQPDPQQQVRLEFRFVETEPADELIEIKFRQTDQTFYLHDSVLLTNADVAEAISIKWQGQFAVEVKFNFTGREKFAELTKNNINRRVGILVDGKLVTAPIIRAPILQGIAIINGDFSEEEAQRIAVGITGR